MMINISEAERRELLIAFIESHTECNKIKEDLTLLTDYELKIRTQIILKALKDSKDTNRK